MVEIIENTRYPAHPDEFLENIQIETATIKAFDELEGQWRRQQKPRQRGKQLKATYRAIVRNYLIIGKQLEWVEHQARATANEIEKAKKEYDEFRRFARLIFLTSSFWSLAYGL